MLSTLYIQLLHLNIYISIRGALSRKTSVASDPSLGCPPLLPPPGHILRRSVWSGCSSVASPPSSPLAARLPALGGRHSATCLDSPVSQPRSGCWQKKPSESSGRRRESLSRHSWKRTVRVDRWAGNSREPLGTCSADGPIPSRPATRLVSTGNPEYRCCCCSFSSTPCRSLGTVSLRSRAVGSLG